MLLYVKLLEVERELHEAYPGLKKGQVWIDEAYPELKKRIGDSLMSHEAVR